MAGKKGENTKKAAGNAKKAEVAAQKRAVEEAKVAKAEEEKWQKGSKDMSKKDAAADKAAEAARKKAEKEALLREEEASQPSKPKGAGAKSAQKKTNGAAPPAPSRGLDLSQLEPTSGGNTTNTAKSLNASGIDDSLAALSLANTSGAGDKIDRHPERRFKAAYAAFEERRLAEMADDKTLRRQQKIELVRKEFEKSPENPFNQALVGTFDMSKDEMRELRERERDKVERRLEGD